MHLDGPYMRHVLFRIKTFGFLDKSCAFETPPTSLIPSSSLNTPHDKTWYGKEIELRVEFLG